MFDYKTLFNFIRTLYPNQNEVHLHEPVFNGNEKIYTEKCITTTMVSSVGEYVDQFERDLASHVGRAHCVSTSSGTTALHLALMTIGVQPGDEIITQSLTFVATANASRTNMPLE